GKTSRHCTFFEMLGHFSFGDYFKREAIVWTWEFFTRVMGIDPERLYCSVYLDDDEAWDIWVNEVGIPLTHMARLGREDNFWDIGSGPCGPSSEIYFDRGAENGCGGPDCKVGCDCDRFVEVGNNVFTQFSNDGQGNYIELAQKNIDFGMGLERLACVVQGVDSVFEVDTITRILRHVSQIAGIPYGQSEKHDMSLRVITDHIRSTVMMICDGVQPGNEKRGYVLRRLLRRAARHGRLLGVEEPFLCALAATVIEESGAAYPDLHKRSDMIRTVIRIEEERFSKTIGAGLAMLRDEIQKTQGTLFSGDPAFMLYDTFGFPVDLTLEILEEEGLTLDRARFDELMQAQRTRAREARAAMGEVSWKSEDMGLDRDLRTEFTGYFSLTETAVVWAAVTDGDRVTLVLDKTPFYAESGGQTSDTGRLYNDLFDMRVTGVRGTGDGKIVHTGELISGEVSTGDTVTAEVGADRRAAVMRAHSATHLLQQALRDVLGSHVEQAGSLVEPDRLRFDFTHFSALTGEEIGQVCAAVNRRILEGLPVTAREMPLAEAKARGAMALFGEKYGETVRTVRMGDYSFELCGGTHLDNTAKAGAFWFRSETSIASGVRRIEARTGLAVLEQLDGAQRALLRASDLLKTSPAEMESKLESALAQSRDAQRELARLKAQLVRADAAALLASAREVKGYALVTGHSGAWDAAALREMGDYLRDKDPNVVAVLAGTGGEKVSLLAVCGKDALARGAHAGSLIRAVSAACGGSGGGKPDSAMGGAKDAARVSEALQSVEGLL
ncbi:MAG: alanine--tRNA ligase, partial [Oscillospiraceae bacterium]|nr:alanine--tRNA ligase [Oscillospiraceae bacterium]